VQAVLRVLSGLVPGNYFVEVPGARVLRGGAGQEQLTAQVTV
jgi:hypothetical protein